MKFLGPHACEEALKRGELQTLWIATGLWERMGPFRKLARAAKVVIHREPPESLDRKTDGQRHQGVLGEGGEIIFASLDSFVEILNGKKDACIFVAIDGVTDPQNLGAILRSCAGAGVDGILLPERRSAGITESVIRASAGTAGQVPIARVTNLRRSLEDMKESGAWIYGMASTPTSINYLEESFDRSVVLVVGSEGDGLHEKIEEYCDVLIHIPMPGQIESLNASVATAVVLFRILATRQ